MLTEEASVKGIFRGVLLESGSFDLMTTNGDVISGLIDSQFDEDKLEQLPSHINQQVQAKLLVAKLLLPSGRSSRMKYCLLDLCPSTD